MNFDQIFAKTENKLIILCKGSKESGKRKEVIDYIINHTDQEQTDIYIIPPNIPDYKELIQHARKSFPIKSPRNTPVDEMTSDQIDDVLLDWTEENSKPVLFIWQEIGSFMSRSDLYGYISNSLTEKYKIKVHDQSKTSTIRLIATCDYDMAEYFENARIYYGREDQDTKADIEIAKENVELIYLE